MKISRRATKKLLSRKVDLLDRLDWYDILMLEEAGDEISRMCASDLRLQKEYEGIFRSKGLR